jgi:hypothetical protein
MPFKEEVRKSVLRYARKCYIKRRLADGSGSYEATWRDVTHYVKNWGTISWTTDDTRFNIFEQSGTTLVMRNDNKEWNEANESAHSLFVGFLSRYKTLIRIDVGLYDANGIIQPTTASVFYGIIIDDIILNSDDEAILSINSLTWALQENKASYITGVNSQTASSLMTLMRDVTNGTGNLLLRPYISQTNWQIDTTTALYSGLQTSSALEGYSCWEMARRLAESENFLIYFGRDGILHFKSRNANTTTAQWVFNGPGKIDPEYGINIVEFKDMNSGWNKIYQRIRIKYGEANTETSYKTLAESFTPGDSSSSWRFGQRTYEFENYWMNSSTASILAQNILNQTVNPKREFTIKTKLITTLDLMDTVIVNWYGQPTVEPVSYWGIAYWTGPTSPDRYYWTGHKGGIYLVSETCVIIRHDADLEELTSTFKLKEVV